MSQETNLVSRCDTCANDFEAKPKEQSAFMKAFRSMCKAQGWLTESNLKFDKTYSGDEQIRLMWIAALDAAYEAAKQISCMSCRAEQCYRINHLIAEARKAGE